MRWRVAHEQPSGEYSDSSGEEYLRRIPRYGQQSSSWSCDRTLTHMNDRCPGTTSNEGFGRCFIRIGTRSTPRPPRFKRGGDHTTAIWYSRRSAEVFYTWRPRRGSWNAIGSSGAIEKASAPSLVWSRSDQVDMDDKHRHLMRLFRALAAPQAGFRIISVSPFRYERTLHPAEVADPGMKHFFRPSRSKHKKNIVPTVFHLRWFLCQT